MILNNPFFMYTEEEKRQYIEELKEIFWKNPKSAGMILKYKKPYLVDFINQMVPLLSDPHYTLSTKVFWILHNITDFPKCATCHKPIIKNVTSVKQGYSKIQHISKINVEDVEFKTIHCSLSCAERDENVKEQINETNIERYGKGNSHNREKAWKTTFEHFGVSNGFKTEVNGKKRIERNRARVESGSIRFLKSHYYFYDNIYFDSIPEIAYYIWLKDNNIEFEYEPKTEKLYYFDDSGKRHRYFPDFKVNGQLIEIKGDHFFDKNGNPICLYNGKPWIEKYNFMKSINVIIYRSAEYNKFIKYVNEKYGKQYLLQCKVTKRE